MPRSRGRGAVGVMAVREPRAVRLDAHEAVLAEQRSPAFGVVAAHLIEHDEDGQLHAGMVQLRTAERRPR